MVIDNKGIIENMVEPIFDYQFRLILIGDSTVGKSSLLKYFTDGKFAEVIIGLLLCDVDLLMELPVGNIENFGIFRNILRGFW